MSKLPSTLCMLKVMLHEWLCGFPVRACLSSFTSCVLDVGYYAAGRVVPLCIPIAIIPGPLSLTATPAASTAPSVPPLPPTDPPTYKPLDTVSLSLLLTVFSSFNIGDPSDTSHLDDSLIDEHFPIIADGTFVPTVHAKILKDGEEKKWTSPGLHAAVKFAWAVLLRECASRATFSGEERGKQI